MAAGVLAILWCPRPLRSGVPFSVPAKLTNNSLLYGLGIGKVKAPAPETKLHDKLRDAFDSSIYRTVPVAMLQQHCSLRSKVDFNNGLQQPSDHFRPTTPNPVSETTYGSTVTSCVSLHRAHNLIDCSRPLDPSRPEYFYLKTYWPAQPRKCVLPWKAS